MPTTNQPLSHGARPVAFTTVIGEHLDKILGSRVFKTSDTLRELLRFTVQETMAGRGGNLKEYVLGTAVLERGESFDPKADSIVRVQMRRLREHLGRYYATEGRHDAVVIEIPRGSYVPAFRTTARDGVAAVPAGLDERLIVGRQRELNDLRSAFESAAAGHGRLICVAGEPGIGKTTVVEVFLRELVTSGAGCYVARGRCSERLAGSEAYLPMLEALESLVRSADESLNGVMTAVAPTWYAEITPLTQVHSSLRGPLPPGPADRTATERQVASQQRLKRELVALLEELTRLQPVVIFLDDLHWADASTVDVLAYAMTRCASRRILIVAAYRPSELLASDHPFQRVRLELQGHGICREIPIEFLTRGDVDSYLGLQFPEHLFPSQLSTRLHERTEGNPLFIADLVRFLRDRGVLEQREGRWVMAGQLPDVERELPESVRSMVDRKIGRLDDADRRLLTAASVQGCEFDSAVVSRALPVDPAEAEERFDTLDAVHGLVTLVSERELPDRTLTLRYRFVHVLYQNALYASLRPTRRVSLSAAIANALLEYSSTHRSAVAAELAMLFEAARDFDRAAEFFQMAAEHAARVSANKEAVVLARRGLNALGLLPQTPERAQQELRLQTILGPALMATAGIGVPEVEAVYVRAQALCQQAGETPQRFTVMFGLFQYWIARGDYRTCEELAGQLLALAQKLRDPSLLLIAHNAVGNTFGLSGEPERAAAHNHQAIAIYVAGQHHSLASFHSGWDPGVACRSALAKNLWILGYPDQAFRAGEDAVAFARELSHSYSMVFALIYNAGLHQHRRDAARTRQQAEAAIALATEQELSQWLPWAGAMHGWAMAEQGHAEEGIAELVQAIARWKAIRAGALTPYFLALLAEAYAKNGQAEASLAALAEALEITARTHEGYVEAELYRLKGELQVEPAEAEACFHQAIDVARRQKAKSFELRAVMNLSRLYHTQGRQTEARQLLAEIYGWFTEGFDTPDLKDARTLLEELQLGTSHRASEASK